MSIQQSAQDPAPDPAQAGEEPYYFASGIESHSHPLYPQGNANFILIFFPAGIVFCVALIFCYRAFQPVWVSVQSYHYDNSNLVVEMYFRNRRTVPVTVNYDLEKIGTGRVGRYSASLGLFLITHMTGKTLPPQSESIEVVTIPSNNKVSRSMVVATGVYYTPK